MILPPFCQMMDVLAAKVARCKIARRLVRGSSHYDKIVSTKGGRHERH